MSKFHIRVEDLETGETYLDTDTDCIVGAVDIGENKTHALGLTCCTPLILAGTILGAKRTIRQVREDHPVIEGIISLYEFLRSDAKTTPDDQNDQNENN
mgnify:CR=1 FL=1